MIFSGEKVLKRVLTMSISGTRGGPMRAKIFLLLIRRPRNTNQISKELSIDYKTADYHMRVLEKTGFVESSGKGYGDEFRLSPVLVSNMKILRDVLGDVGKTLNKKGGGD